MSGLRVLVVDDSLTVRMDIADALKADGFDAVPCSDLAAARKALQVGPCALVILDLLLPDGDGLDLLKELRSAEETRELPVLLLSSEAEVKSRVVGIGAGASEYLGKPYDLAQVVARARGLTHVQPGSSSGGPRQVLIIDDSPSFRAALRESLEAEGLSIHEAITGEDGLNRAAALRPDAVVVDGVLPGIDGATVVRRLKSDAGLRATPCLLLTAAEGASAELAALEAGADAYAGKSEDLSVIGVRLKALMRAAGGGVKGASLLSPKRLLAVDDSATYLHALGVELRREGYDVVLAKSGEEALALLEVQDVDCVLLDLVMPGLSGVETCRRIKGSPRWRDVPLMMLTARDDRATMIEGINAGADDYIAKTADLDVLKARLRAQLRRKHFEDENRRIREELVRSHVEARFQRLLHSNIIGVFVSEPGGRLVDANDTFLSMLGYTREELAAGALRWQALTPAKWRARADEAAAQLQREGSAVPWEQELSRKSGDPLPALVGATELDGARHRVGFVLDRTEQKLAEQKLRSQALALEAANRELESFSYSVAHDLRAPLRSISGFSQILQEDCGDRLGDEGRGHLGRIVDATGRMSRLIDDLLGLSRLTRQELTRVSVDLSALARQILGRLAAAEPGRQVDVEVQNGLLAEGDPGLLAAALENLLGNAWKFTSRRERARIEVGSMTADGARAFFVRDNGAGFDMQYASRLFGVFQRLHSSKEFEGTGIGLATVNRIVQRHGGRVWAEGRAGEGATFYFTLEGAPVSPAPG